LPLTFLSRLTDIEAFQFPVVSWEKHKKLPVYFERMGTDNNSSYLAGNIRNRGRQQPRFLALDVAVDQIYVPRVRH
jgi:hypothetical protein